MESSLHLIKSLFNLSVFYVFANYRFEKLIKPKKYIYRESARRNLQHGVKISIKIKIFLIVCQTFECNFFWNPKAK